MDRSTRAKRQPRDRAGRFAYVRGGQVETEVYRDTRGRVRKQPAARRALTALRRWARGRDDVEDRLGRPLRYGSAGVAGWWYMVKGAQRWIRRGSKPAWHHGYYYAPHTWMPVVPPRDTWEKWNTYHGIPGQTPMSSVVPDEVLRAARMEPEDLAGRRVAGDSTPRREAFARRRNRSGVGLDYGRAKGVTARTVTRKKRAR